MHALLCVALLLLADCPPQPRTGWLVQYAGVTVAEFVTLEEAERYAWQRIRRRCEPRWLFEIRLARPN